jgi:protein regulator of cytokinesis 1
VTGEKEDMIKQAKSTIKAIRQMEASLDQGGQGNHRASRRDSDGELKVTFPLARCLQNLGEKHAQAARRYRDRYEQVKSGWPLLFS